MVPLKLIVLIICLLLPFRKCDGLEISRLVCLIMACLTWFVKGAVRSWSKSEEFQRKRVFMKMVIYYFETYVNINENKKFSKTDCAWLLQKIIRNLERNFLTLNDWWGNHTFSGESSPLDIDDVGDRRDDHLGDCALLGYLEFHHGLVHLRALVTATRVGDLLELGLDSVVLFTQMK